MYKTLSFLSLMCLFLAACSKQPQPFTSFEDAQTALKSLNTALVQTKKIKIDTLTDEQLVFSDAYLAKRHAIYQSLMDMQLESNQIAQVNYLVIAERFPERYFNWPAQINVLENMLAFDGTKHKPDNIIKWLKLTQDQLDSAKHSNLKLNKVELSLLNSYVDETLKNNKVQGALQSHLRAFSVYLSNYKVRGSVGLRGLANGSEWYQSKLNYFSGAVHSPLEWASLLNKKINMLKVTESISNVDVPKTHEYSFIVQVVKSSKQIPGLGWQSHYLDLPSMAANMNASASNSALMLVMMETDVGIHYHAWTLPQAKVNLIKRLKISPEFAQYLVEDIILYPGQSFSFASTTL